MAALKLYYGDDDIILLHELLTKPVMKLPQIMPAIMQKIAVISINYWGIQGFYDIFWRHLPIHYILIRAAVLLGIAAFMTLISIKNFRKNILSIV